MVHSNEMACRKRGRLGLDPVILIVLFTFRFAFVLLFALLSDNILFQCYLSIITICKNYYLQKLQQNHDTVAAATAEVGYY